MDERWTANGKYSYNTLYAGKTLDNWIQSTHAENCRVNGWVVTPLKPGAFGYDNLACSLHYLFACLAETKTCQISHGKLASAVHDGWMENYVYWRDNEPWRDSSFYRAPAKPLGDARRNSCLVSYENLPLEEQDKDMIIVKFVCQS
jgi:hypothetical protein